MIFLAFLFIGLLMGFFANFTIRNHGLGMLEDLGVGVMGAFVGGFLLNVLGTVQQSFWKDMGMSVLGALTFLFIADLMTKPRNLGSQTHQVF